MAKLLVGVLTTLVVLTGCALFPTALNRSERVAQSQLPVSAWDGRDSGILVRQYDDYFAGEPIEVVLVSVVDTADQSYLGMRLPAPGEIATSPGLRRDLEQHRLLRQRYHGTIVGEVPDSFLVGPDSRSVWVGTEAARMPPEAGWLRASVQGSESNHDIAQAVPDALSYAVPVLVLGFVLPLLALAGLLSSLGGRRRNGRLAALRLMGLRADAARAAGALQEGVIATLAAAVGCVVFGLLAPIVAPRVPAAGGVWPSDVEVAWPAGPLIVACLPLIATAAAWVSLPLRTGQDALNVERDTGPVRVARSWALALLISGTAGIAGSYVPALPKAWSSVLLLCSTGVTGIGLVLSLPVAVAHLAPRLRRTSLPSLLAAAKLSHDPVRSTRVASGLTMMVLASGLMLMFFPLISAVDANEFEDAGSEFGHETLIGQLPPVDSREAGRARDAAWRGLNDDHATYLRVRTMTVKPLGKPGVSLTVLLVDCAELAALSDVSEGTCTRGFVLNSAFARSADTFRFVARRTGGQGGVPDAATPAALSLPGAVMKTRTVAVLESVIDSGATFLASAELAPHRQLSQAPTTVLARPRTGMLEQTRTDLLTGLATGSLTFRENYEVSTHTTRQFLSILQAAAALVAIICGLSVLTAAYDQLRSSRPERRLLAVAGCRPRVTMSSLMRQMVAPVLLGVLSAGILAVAVANGFVRLSANSLVALPLGGIAATCLVAILSPVAACAIALTLESHEELLRATD